MHNTFSKTPSHDTDVSIAWMDPISCLLMLPTNVRQIFFKSYIISISCAVKQSETSRYLEKKTSGVNHGVNHRYISATRASERAQTSGALKQDNHLDD